MFCHFFYWFSKIATIRDEPVQRAAGRVALRMFELEEQRSRARRVEAAEMLRIQRLEAVAQEKMRAAEERMVQASARMVEADQRMAVADMKIQEANAMTLRKVVSWPAFLEKLWRGFAILSCLDTLSPYNYPIIHEN